MKRLRAKLKSQQGETLVELLASILISTLSVGLLLGAVAVSANLNRQAETADKTFYDALTAAESRATPATVGVAEAPKVTVTETGGSSVSLDVVVYGGDGLWSYALKTGGGGS